MQIDLANILVHKAYFVYYVLFIISPQAPSPLLWRFLSPGGGTEGGLKTIERGRFPGVGGEAVLETGRAHRQAS